MKEGDVVCQNYVMSVTAMRKFMIELKWNCNFEKVSHRTIDVCMLFATWGLMFRFTIITAVGNIMHNLEFTPRFPESCMQVLGIREEEIERSVVGNYVKA